jgi:hypothetical protein
MLKIEAEYLLAFKMFNNNLQDNIIILESYLVIVNKT